MRDIIVEEIANEVIAGKRVIYENVSCLCFTGEDGYLPSRFKKTTIEGGKKFAKAHNDRFGLWVLEVIKRKK